MEIKDKNPARTGEAGEPPRGQGHTPGNSRNPGQGRNRNRNRHGKNRPDNSSAPTQGTETQRTTETTPRERSAVARPAPAGEGAERRNRPSTGRPQRVPHRSDRRDDLPNMDDLLIDDGSTPDIKSQAIEDEIDQAEIQRILDHDLLASPHEPIPEVLPEGKVVIVGIRFRTGGKTYFFDPGDATYQVGQSAIVETARGQEFGDVCMANRMLDISQVVLPLRPVIRLATPEDMAHNAENNRREEEAFRIGVQKICEHKLDMKLVAVQYTFDNSKLLFYFTSAKRVDFRELVKDLAGVFHVRIELRQIGIRDEARMIGGLGPCGRPLCCTTFLSDFGQVSMKMAKEQNLSLNSTKISGCCGRLMCCLRYEHETYLDELRRTPAVGTFVNTPEGPGVVTEVYLLQGEVKVSLKGQTDSQPKRYKRELVEPQHRDRRPAIDEAIDEPDTDC